jgi:hypothetical protein
LVCFTDTGFTLPLLAQVDLRVNMPFNTNQTSFRLVPEIGVQ